MAQNATHIILQIGGVKLVGELSASKSSTADVIDLSSKASGRVREIELGRVNENISFESLADDESSDYGYDAAYSAMADGELINYKLVRVDTDGDQVIGSEQDSGTGYIASLTLDNPDNDRSTMSGTIEIDDESTVEAYTPGD